MEPVTSSVAIILPGPGQLFIAAIAVTAAVKVTSYACDKGFRVLDATIGGKEEEVLEKCRAFLAKKAAVPAPATQVEAAAEAAVEIVEAAVEIVEATHPVKKKHGARKAA